MRKRQKQAESTTLAEFTVFVQKNYPTAQVTSTGLYYIIEQQGEGIQATKHRNVSVHYTGTLTDGTVFDSSHKRNQPLTPSPPF